MEGKNAEYCPECNKLSMYAEHTTDNKWAIGCIECGYTTKPYSSYIEARAEYERTLKGRR